MQFKICCQLTLFIAAPKPPKNIVGTPIDTKTVRLTWKPGGDGGSEIEGYRLEYQEEGFGRFETIIKDNSYSSEGYKVGGVPLVYDATGLKAGFPYKFSVQGINKHGVGERGYSELTKPKSGGKLELNLWF